jgi:hypothetical protein
MSRLVKPKENQSKSIHSYRDEVAFNIDLEFEDKSMLDMIFCVGFRSIIKLLENKYGDYQIRKRFKSARSVTVLRLFLAASLLEPDYPSKDNP